MVLMLSSWSLVPQSPNIMVPRHSLLTWTPVRPSGRSSMGRLPSVGRDQADGQRGHGGADDRADDRRAVPVVFAVVGLVDAGVRAGVGFGEGDVAFDAAGPDPAGAAGLGAAEPAVVRAVGAADVEVVAVADHPDGHVRPQGAVGAPGADLQLLGAADAAQLIVVPRRCHGFTRTLRASRSSMAAYPQGSAQAGSCGRRSAGF